MGVNKVEINTPEGKQVLIDVTSDTVTPITLAEGYTATNAAGEKITGEMLVTNVLYTPQTLTEEQKIQARANIGAAEYKAPTDEDLLKENYTLDYDTDLNYKKVWIGSGALFDVSTTQKFSTRKFKTNKIPRIASEWNIHTNCEYYFFNGGTVVGQVLYGVLSQTWSVDFEFTHVAINFSWGCDDHFNSKLSITMWLPEKADGFSDKKVLVIGDSISTDYYGNYPKWVTNLVNEGFLPADVTNSSTHATGFVARYTADDTNAKNDFISRLEEVGNKNSYDLVVVFGGINDYIKAIPMGESGGDKLTYFVPAVDYFFEYLVNNFAQARIVVLLPLRTYNIWDNTAGHKQTEYADYIKQVAKNYCLPILNLTEESGFCPFNDTFKEMWTLIPDGYSSADGVHPNEAYQKKFLAPLIKNFLRSFI